MHNGKRKSHCMDMIQIEKGVQWTQTALLNPRKGEAESRADSHIFEGDLGHESRILTCAPSDDGCLEIIEEGTFTDVIGEGEAMGETLTNSEL
jgi:hypothetical protein